MSDNAPATEPAPEPAPTPAPQTAAEPAKTPDPTPEPSPKSPPSAALTEALVDGLDGEAAEFAKRFASKKDLVNAAIELRKKNSSMVNVPKEGAAPEQIAAFRKAIGAPESVEGYAFTDKEGSEPTEVDKAVRGKVAEILHKHHAPASMAGELQAVVEEVADSMIAEENRVAEAFRNTSQAQLKTEWGADYDANVELAKRARDKLGSPALAEFLNTPVNGHLLGDHPEMIRFFGKIGRSMGESEFIGAMGAEQVQSINDKLADLDKQFHVAYSKGDRMTYQQIDRQRSELIAKLHGSEPIVGSEGRAV